MKVRGLLRWMAAGALAAVCLTACSGEKPIPQAPVTKAGFAAQGKIWPLSVEEGVVGCDVGSSAYWFESGGVRYGLNGFASLDRGYAQIEPIWLFDEKQTAELRAAIGKEADQVTQPRLNIGDMINAARAACEA